MNLDVIVAVYNTPDVEALCIETLLGGSLPDGARLIVIDDASPDRTTQLRYENDSRLTYHRLDTNVGPHAAWNAAVKLSRPDAYIALVGSDCLVGEGVLNLMMKAWRFLGAGLVSASEYQGVLDNDTSDVVRANNAFAVETGSLSFGPGGMTSCSVFSRAAWDSVGGFDGRFKRTFGDVDLHQRLVDAGFPCWRLTNVQVLHGGSVSRKRGGAEADLVFDRADYDLFRSKWAHRPELLAQHVKPPAAQDLAAKRYFWREGYQ